MVLRKHASSQLRVELRDLRLCCSKVHAMLNLKLSTSLLQLHKACSDDPS